MFSGPERVWLSPRTSLDRRAEVHGRAGSSEFRCSSWEHSARWAHEIDGRTFRFAVLFIVVLGNQYESILLQHGPELKPSHFAPCMLSCMLEFRESFFGMCTFVSGPRIFLFSVRFTLILNVGILLLQFFAV